MRLWGGSLINGEQYDRGLAVWLYVNELYREHSLPLKTRHLRCFAEVFAHMVLESLALPIDIVRTVFKLLIEELNTKIEDFDDHLLSLLFLITITAQVQHQTPSVSFRVQSLS